MQSSFLSIYHLFITQCTTICDFTLKNKQVRVTKTHMPLDLGSDVGNVGGYRGV